jgi:ABC-type branched-subunit amino acid transport system ATPase component
MLGPPGVADSERMIHAAVDELIDTMGLGAFRNKFVNELSTGTRRIVELACLVAHRPSVLLLDEPSSGIAQRETEALGPLLLRIRERTAASLLVIEHDMPLITSVSDRMLALDLGRVVIEGSAETRFIVFAPPPEILKLITSNPPDAFAALIASRKVQSALQVPSLWSSAVVTVNDAAWTVG